MTAMVRVNAGDRAVTIHRVEAQGGTRTLQPGQHETFTVRADEAITIQGDKVVSGLAPEHPEVKPPSDI